MRALLCVALAVRQAAGSIMDFDATFNSLKMEILSEGPMYTTEESPFRQTGKKSKIAVALNWFPLRAEDPHTVAVVFTTNASVTSHAGLPERVLQCAEDHTTDSYEAHFYNTAGTITTSYEITRPSVGGDFPRVLLFVCPCVQPSPENEIKTSDPARCWTNGNKEGVQFHGQISFSNGFGYLAAKQLGYLPFYAAMTVAYFLLLTVYLVACMFFRHHLTALNYATLALCVVGMVECTLYFVLYLWKNTTGTPTWPPTPLQWAAAFVGVLKRDLSRVVLIVVGLGYGVARDSLPKLAVAGIVVLALSFFGLSIWKDIAKDSLFVDATAAETTILTLNESMLLLVDVVMLAWCLLALVNTLQSLESTKQVAKLRMYNTLIGVLLAFVVVWGLFEAYRITVVKGIFELNWHLSWILNSFWHASSFAVHVTIAIVWRPSNTSEQLSYWSQLGTFDESSEEEEISMVEMGEEDEEDDESG
jgi:hypothetical protein